jgi:hypothetical protein
VAGALVVELMRQAARDADLECQRSAHAALTDLPLGADDLLPLLQSSGGRKRARRGASHTVSAGKISPFSPSAFFLPILCHKRHKQHDRSFFILLMN